MGPLIDAGLCCAAAPFEAAGDLRAGALRPAAAFFAVFLVAAIAVLSPRCVSGAHNRTPDARLQGVTMLRGTI